MRPLIGKGANVEEQLTLFEVPAPEQPSVWLTLTAEERGLVVSMLVHVMARIVAELAAHPGPQEDGDD